MSIQLFREPLPARPDLIRVGTRGSRLAVTQSRGVAARIASATGFEVALVAITTSGDVSREPLAKLGGTGVFVSALRDALIGGECDVAVHSLKDLPTGQCPGIALGAVPERADPRDALCARDGLTLRDLPAGASVGTGSPRRTAQLLAQRADLTVTDMRGNVETRLARIGHDLDAVVLAAAGLERIGSSDVITERFDPQLSPPAAGQGALAVEIRQSDAAGHGPLADPLAFAMAALNDRDARLTALAEQGVLAALDAGCAAPIGTWAHTDGGRIQLTATVYREDGSEQLSASVADTVPAAWPGDDWAARIGADAASLLLQRGAHAVAPLGTIGVTA